MKNLREEPNNLHFLPPVNPMLYEMKLASAIKDRKIHVCGVVEQDSIFEALYMVQKLERKDRIENTKNPIEIIIGSNGGSVPDGLALISRIFELRDKGYEIITTVSSVAYSMGFMILIAGSKRQAYRYARVMLHQLSAGTFGAMQTMIEDVDEFKKYMDVLREIIVENTDITNEQLDDITIRKFDWYMDVKEALELNVIDVIL